MIINNFFLVTNFIVSATRRGLKISTDQNLNSDTNLLVFFCFFFLLFLNNYHQLENILLRGFNPLERTRFSDILSCFDYFF